MNRLAFACSAILLAVAPVSVAQTQKAPITRGATSTNLADAVQETRQNNAALSLEVTRLESEVAQLNGKIETLEFLLSQSRDEMERLQTDDAALAGELESLRSVNADLNSRLQDLENDIQAILTGNVSEDGEIVGTAGRPADPSGDAEFASNDTAPRRIVTRSSGTTSTISQATISSSGENPAAQGSLGTLTASDLPGEAGPLFATAKSRLLKFDYVGAEQAFRSFLDRFGDDPQAGEAQYWLAETLFQQEAYAESGVAYTQMIREYPEDARAPDALVKLARSMRLVGDTQKACNALSILPQQYPNASGVTRNLAALESTRAGCDT